MGNYTEDRSKWFTDNLPKVGDIVQHVAHYTGYVREVNRNDGYVKIKWYKGTDNIFEDHQFFKYSPWNGEVGTIQVVTAKVPREWWPEGNDWLFINLDIWRSYHQLTELEMIEMVHDAGGPLVFATQQGIYQIARWTPPEDSRMVLQFPNESKITMYEDFETYKDNSPTIDMFPIGETVTVDSYEHQLNGKIVDNSDFPETVDVEFDHMVWGVNYQDLYKSNVMGPHISLADMVPLGHRLYVQVRRDERVLGVVVDREDEDNFVVYFSRVIISVAVDLLIVE